jgi:two-component system cell cycle sensor histidine kinase/response regulator CckA
MEKHFQKLWSWVAHGQNVTLQERLYRLLSLCSGFVCLAVVLPVNLLQSLPLFVNLADITLGLFALHLYRESTRGVYRPVLFFVAAVVLMDLAWFPNAGSEGSVTFYFITAVAFPLAMCRGRTRWVLVAFLQVNLCALLLLEHFYPGLVTPFRSPNDRLIDILSGAVCAPLAAAIVIWVVLTSYDREHSLIESVSQKLATSERSYRQLVETTNTVIVRLDHGGDVRFFNKFAEDLFGYTREEVMGKSFLETLLSKASISGNDSAALIKEALRDPSLQKKFEMEMCRRDRTPVWISWTYLPIYSERNELNEILCVGVDITERRRDEERRQQQERQLAHVQRLESLGFLAGGLAHDFNNLLTAILGNASLLKHSLGSGSAERELLVEVENASLRARELTLQLLTFAKGGDPVRESVSLEELLRNAASLSLRGSSVRCNVEVAPGCWPVIADVGQIGQVLNNLLLNAQQAMSDGGTIHITVENQALDPANNVGAPEGRYVRVAIRDSGIGIPEENLKRIFDPYFTTKATGSGLGLAVVFSILKRHGGHVSVVSRPGVGSTFSLLLPATPEPVTKPAAKDLPAAPRSGRILVMDDEPMVRRITAKALERLGFETSHANDGTEALEMYETARRSARPFDAVIMDLTIPGGMGGKEAIRRLLEIDPNAKAIVSSGYSDDPVMSDHQAHGFTAVMMKPYSLEGLRKVIEEVIPN